MALDRLGRHLHAVLTAQSIEDVWDLHVRKMAEYDFDRLIYGSTRFSATGAYGEISDALVLTNHDKEYIDVFFGEELYLHAPMAVWAYENTGVSSWQQVAATLDPGTLTTEQKRILELNQRLDVSAGYSISFNAVSVRSKGAIGLCARRGLSQDDVEAIWAASGDEIELLNRVLHLAILQLPHTAGRRPLTPRQREVLQWVADGKTIQDVAVLMHLNPNTIEKHLRLARENLNAENTAQAILKASMQNQFFLFEDV